MRQIFTRSSGKGDLLLLKPTLLALCFEGSVSILPSVDEKRSWSGVMAIFGHRQRLFYSIYLFLLQYTFNLKMKLEWGYDHIGMVSLCFRGAVFLVLSLRQS